MPWDLFQHLLHRGWRRFLNFRESTLPSGCDFLFTNNPSAIITLHSWKLSSMGACVSFDNFLGLEYMVKIDRGLSKLVNLLIKLVCDPLFPVNSFTFPKFGINILPHLLRKGCLHQSCVLLVLMLQILFYTLPSSEPETQDVILDLPHLISVLLSKLTSLTQQIPAIAAFFVVLPLENTSWLLSVNHRGNLTSGSWHPHSTRELEGPEWFV